MKKLLILFPLVLLLAAACNQQSSSVQNGALSQTPVAQTPTPATQTTTPPTNSPQSSTYENDYMKLTIPNGWVATEAAKKVYSSKCVNKQNCTQTVTTEPNPAAVNIINGNYILYVNVQASQASGVQGGRFSEIGMGSPSVDAVVTEEPSVCGTSVMQTSPTDHPRIDMYVGPQDKQLWCSVPSNGKTVWYFSYITDKDHGYFNYYKTQQANGVVGYVITMSYNSKNVNSFPEKGSTELNAMLSQMTSIANSLLIKQQ